MLEDNKQKISNNISSAENLSSQVQTMYSKMRHSYGLHKSKMDEWQRDHIDKAINKNKHEKLSDDPSQLDKSFSDITKWQQKLVDQMFIISAMKEAFLENKDHRLSNKTSGYLEDSENIIKQFNSLTQNIYTLSSKNVTIQKLVDKKNEYFPQDSSDVVQTDFSSFEPFDE
jgi:hypothetical protein